MADTACCPATAGIYAKRHSGQMRPGPLRPGPPPQPPKAPACASSKPAPPVSTTTAPAANNPLIVRFKNMLIRSSKAPASTSADTTAPASISSAASTDTTAMGKGQRLRKPSITSAGGNQQPAQEPQHTSTLPSPASSDVTGPLAPVTLQAPGTAPAPAHPTFVLPLYSFIGQPPAGAIYITDAVNAQGCIRLYSLAGVPQATAPTNSTAYSIRPLYTGPTAAAAADNMNTMVHNTQPTTPPTSTKTQTLVEETELRQGATADATGPHASQQGAAAAGLKPAVADTKPALRLEVDASGAAC